MIDRVSRFLAENEIDLAGKNLILAVSGGADSMAMLHLFARNRECFGVDSLYCCHFNHGLRGRESDLDEELVAAYALRLAVPFFAAKGEMADRKLPKGESVESYARTLRYTFFEKRAAELGALIATAHNQNDNVETVLFHLARGTGMRGAAGIPPRRGNIVRPFLPVGRGEIEQYCAEEGIPFRTDATNAETVYTRNYIRHELLPRFNDVNGDAVANIARFSVLAREADAFFERAGDALLARAATANGYLAETLLEADPAVQKYALRQLFLSRSANISEALIGEGLAVICGDKQAAQLGRTLYFVRAGDIVALAERPPQAETEADFCIAAHPGRTALPGGEAVFIESYDIINGNTTKKVEIDFQNCLDYGKIVGGLCFRNRLSSDTFRPAKRGQTKTLKKLYNEMKIAPQKRHAHPLLADDAGVVWVKGAGVAERVLPDAGTATILKITAAEDRECTGIF